MQNSARVDVDILWLQWGRVPLYVVIVLSFLLGAFVGAVLVLVRHRRVPPPPPLPPPPRPGSSGAYRPPGVVRPPSRPR